MPCAHTRTASRRINIDVDILAARRVLQQIEVLGGFGLDILLATPPLSSIDVDARLIESESRDGDSSPSLKGALSLREPTNTIACIGVETSPSFSGPTAPMAPTADLALTHQSRRRQRRGLVLIQRSRRRQRRRGIAALRDATLERAVRRRWSIRRVACWRNVLAATVTVAVPMVAARSEPDGAAVRAGARRAWLCFDVAEARGTSPSYPRIGRPPAVGLTLRRRR